MSQTLFFSNPTSQDGINITVRRGRKWDEAITSLPTIVDVKQTGQDEVLGQVEIVGKLVIPFVLLTEDLLVLEHDEDCTYYDGLHDTMLEAYGEDFDEEEEVTVLFFMTAEEEYAG